MLGSILRLAMLASSGAGVATGLRHAVLKLAALLAAALCVTLIIAAAITAFSVAVYFALAPELGPVWAAAACGLLLLALAAILALIARQLYIRRRRAKASSAAGFGGGLGGPLGAAALGASMSAGPGFDIKGLLERNAVTVLLTAFIAGMVMNNRR